MRTFTKPISAMALASLVVLGVGLPDAQAQLVNPIFQVPFGVNPYYRVRPGLTVSQAAFNISTLGQAYANVPPYALGYNPYPRPIISPYVPYPYPGPLYTNSYSPYSSYNPYLSPSGGYTNPYTPAGTGYSGASLANPYLPSGSAYDLSSAYNPYSSYGDPFGGFLRGTADVIRAQSSLMLDQERARMLRESALQARLDTRKKALETELWIKANTPTFTDEQAKIAKTILKRIQTNASPAEIMSGKALNVLLDDLSKHLGQRAAAGAMIVDDEVARHLNITRSGLGDLGLLRNDGRFTWPKALRELANPAEQKEIEVQAQAVVSQAANGKADENLLSELKTNVDKLRTQLSAKMNEFGTPRYMESKRFLHYFEEALLALEKGDAVDYFNFQKYAPGKSAQDIAKYMVDRGLRFAPAVGSDDEAAYIAMHSFLAAYDVAINTQDVAANKD
jgi:hypothetical protein